MTASKEGSREYTRVCVHVHTRIYFVYTYTEDFQFNSSFHGSNIYLVFSQIEFTLVTFAQTEPLGIAVLLKKQDIFVVIYIQGGPSISSFLMYII